MRGLLSLMRNPSRERRKVDVADVVVRSAVGHRDIRVALVEATREAGCEILHVDFDSSAQRLYLDACGFKPTGPPAERRHVEGLWTVAPPHSSGTIFGYRPDHR
jgi:hypothetical protein